MSGVPRLEVEGLSAGHGALQVVRQVSFAVMPGEIVALLGPNGAGKSTVLHALAGLLRPVSGCIRFDGERIEALAPEHVSRRGVALVSESSNLFLGMTVEENLRLGGARLTAGRYRTRRAAVEDLFPVLAARRRQLAGTLSGGERKMLGLGRGLMTEPRLLLVDEPSLGLAPLVAESVFADLAALNREGLTILLVEQNVHTTLAVAARGYVLEHGEVALAGTTEELLRSPHVRASYLGITVEA